MHRRHFLGTAALAATSLMLPWVGGAQAFAAPPRRRLLPPALNPGDTIGSVAAPTKYYSAEGSNVYFALTHNGEPVNGEALFR